MNKQPTPETDQFKIKLKTTCGEKHWVPVEHSERLERERDRAREDATNYYAKIGELEQERDEAWACCDELVVDSNAITLAKTVMRLERERDELLQWKKETLLVESQWDEQAVGRLLGLQLGDFIKPNIEPTLRQLIKERDKAREDATNYFAKVGELQDKLNEAREELKYLKARCEYYDS